MGNNVFTWSGPSKVVNILIFSLDFVINSSKVVAAPEYFPGVYV